MISGLRKSDPVNAIIQKINTTAEPLTEGEVHLLTHDLVRQVRQTLRRELARAAGKDGLSGQFQSLTADNLRGLSQFARHLTLSALSGIDTDIKAVSTDRLPGALPHSATAIGLPTALGSQWFLIDPTFLQHCAETAAPGGASPGAILRQHGGGNAVRDQLIHCGLVELTPRTADVYLSSLCHGRSPFSSGAASLSFLIDKDETDRPGMPQTAMANRDLTPVPA